MNDLNDVSSHSSLSTLILTNANISICLIKGIAALELKYPKSHQLILKQLIKVPLFQMSIIISYCQP